MRRSITGRTSILDTIDPHQAHILAGNRRAGIRRPRPALPKRKPAAKPHGPLIIAISIDQQKVRIYDANGFFAESPVSTGMKGHSTPMGVFSVIQKHKLHHSNIYSNAPMPYMQRITWSGVAMHAGVLPGYPASHGCIRMPMAFAVKMWNWTKMGARVIITPGEITPASFSHPLLVAQKVAPQPVIADEPKSDLPKSDFPKTDAPAVKSDKGADAGSAIKSTSPEALELRSTVGHASPVATLSPEQTRTADASAAMPSMIAAVTMSDARPSTGGRQQASEAATSDVKSADSGATDKDGSDDRREGGGKACRTGQGRHRRAVHRFYRCEERSGAPARRREGCCRQTRSRRSAPARSLCS